MCTICTLSGVYAGSAGKGERSDTGAEEGVWNGMSRVLQLPRFSALPKILPHSSVLIHGVTSLNYSSSSPPLIRMPLLTNNSLLIREVSFGWMKYYMHSHYLLSVICVFSRDLSSLERALF